MNVGQLSNLHDTLAKCSFLSFHCTLKLIQTKIDNHVSGLPLITDAPRGRRGEGGSSLPLRITCKKEGGIQKACKTANTY